MDVNGITWVGGVYHKFECMCLEVEENMYEDTVKFVENQVQTVGASVKKFYADVMQDLLSQSSMDPEKISASGFPVEHNFDVDNSKKSKISKKEEPVKVDVEQINGDSEVIAVTNRDVDHKPLLHGQHIYDSRTLSSGNCAKGACFHLYSRQDHDGSNLNNRNFVVKENPMKDRFPGAISPVEKDLIRQSSSCSEILNETHEASCPNTCTVIRNSIAEGMARDSTRECCVIANASQCTDDVCRSSDMIAVDNSDGKEWQEILDSSFGGLTGESNGFSLGGQVQYESERYAHMEVSASHPGGSRGSSWDAVESYTVAALGMDTIKQSDKAKLEETCVMVTGEDIHFVPHMEGKHRPYKKKIQKAFASRMRSARKQEYEQLALWYGDDAKSNLYSGEGHLHSLTMEETEKSQAHDFCESEWEIL